VFGEASLTGLGLNAWPGSAAYASPTHHLSRLPGRSPSLRCGSGLAQRTWVAPVRPRPPVLTRVVNPTRPSLWPSREPVARCMGTLESACVVLATPTRAWRLDQRDRGGSRGRIDSGYAPFTQPRPPPGLPGLGRRSLALEAERRWWGGADAEVSSASVPCSKHAQPWNEELFDRFADAGLWQDLPRCESSLLRRLA